MVGISVFILTAYTLILTAITLDGETASSEAGLDVSSSVPAAITNAEPAAIEQAPDLTAQSTAPSVATETTSAPAAEQASDQPPASSAAVEQPRQTDTQPDTSNEEPKQELIQSATILTANGDGYTVSAVVDGSSQLPVGVELKVRKLDSSGQEFQESSDKSKAVLGTNLLDFATFFDVSFIHNGQEVQPSAPVQVTLQTEDNLAGKEQDFKVVHFKSNGEKEVINPESVNLSTSQTKVTYKVSSFSVQGFVVLGKEEPVQATENTENSQEETQEEVAEENTNEENTNTEASSDQGTTEAADTADKRVITFVFQNNNNEEENVTTLHKKDGDKLATLPAAPFKTGYIFDHWQNKVTGETVTADTVVNGDMTVEAVFNEIKIYTVTIEYYYHNSSSDSDVVFDKEIHQIEISDTPYHIIPPTSTNVSKDDDTNLEQDAIYYPEKAVVEITADQLENSIDGKIDIKVKYVPASSKYTVRYMLKDLDGKNYTEIKSVTAYGALGSTVNAEVLSFDYATFEKTEPLELTQEEGQEVNVYYTRNSYNLTYEPNGGSYVDYQTGLYNQSVSVTSATPTRVGYTFAGWYKDPDFKQKAGTSVTLDKDVTLYAKWEPKNVHYTVVYLKEKYDNATGKTSFEYDSSLSQTGKTGATVSASNAPNITTDKTGYERDTAQNATSETTIAADGSSILKVYYKLIRYTFVFDADGPVYNGRNTVNGKITINGHEYVNKTYTIDNVVLGQDISTTWPSGTQVSQVSSWRPGSYSFYAWLQIKNNPTVGDDFYVTKQFEVTADLVKAADSQHKVTYQSYWLRRGYSYTVHYHLQDENGSYQLSDKYSQTFYSPPNTDLLPKEIDGFDYDPDISNDDGEVYNFYYNRKQYQIDYYNKDQELTSKKKILFGANINNDTYNWTPERPGDVDSDYTWKGWYMDADLTTPYQFNVMPSSNLVLYANWEAPHYTVSFDVNGGDSKAPESQSIEKYKVATVPDTPTKEHHIFAGWYTADGKRYDWSKPVTEDITLTAHWVPEVLSYTIKYLDADNQDKELAPSKTVESPSLVEGQELTVSALAITGYRPDEHHKTITLDYDNNEIIFYYTAKAATVDYTVKYLLADNQNIEVAPSETKTVEGSQINAKELAVEVDKDHMKTQDGVTDDMLAQKYYPEEVVQTLVLTSKAENNVITFLYHSYDSATLTVNYLDMDGNPIPGKDAEVITHTVPFSYAVDETEISGYTFHNANDVDGNDVDGSYFIKDGGSHVLNLYYQKDLILTAKSKEKTYDGEALTSDGVDDLVSDYAVYLAEGDTITSVTYDGSQTEAGTSNSLPSDVTIVDKNGKDHTDYYHISYASGTLTVNQAKVEVYIDGDQKEKFYDGVAETITYTVKINDPSGKYQESDLAFTGEAKEITQKDAGHYDLILKDRFVNNNKNFDVQMEVSNGSLEIKKRRVVLTSDSAQKGFDGTALTAETVTATEFNKDTGEGFVPLDDLILIYDFTGSQTAVGASENTFTYKVDNALNDTKLSNYDVQTEYGLLQVLPTLNIQKTTSQWEPLSGGQFTISRWNEGSQNWEALEGVSELTITSSDGVTIPIGLTEGQYRIQETAAPDGYVVLEEAIYFNIAKETTSDDEDNPVAESYTVTLTDADGRAQLEESTTTYSHRIKIANQAGTALPNTGGPGTYWYVLVGLLLMGFPFIWFILKNINSNDVL
ncbi:InlB B-repeat-containing protein [Streptococcus alactolyticus]|uniref:InlB B-repeat-containing protein n=1 Tax=Streptococcus alactolyticus TaxID=29389 RepID=A0ABY7LX82_STRAY|nr:InlB B-repeat-containing protein [Streptococcus alactolyticus]WBB06191.1 InlB B-repeat-containing protein [Streptococcus alactolyticus]